VPDRGFAPPADPFNPVTAISIYLSHVDRCVALVLKPKTYTYEQAREICDSFEDTFLFEDEAELLKTFLTIIEDVDCLSGWNSTLFDIPYLVNRITRVLGSDYTRALCLWNQKPRPRVVPKNGKDHDSLPARRSGAPRLSGTLPEAQSAAAAELPPRFIGEIEVGENKVQYEGHLDDLYHKDLFKFIAYSRQDTMLLVKIDAKKQFIELANQIAHVNTVLLQTTMGSVALVEQAIINEMHDLGFVVPCRKGEIVEQDAETTMTMTTTRMATTARSPVVGAYVAKPKKGLHSHVACVDINSLYPSAIRALNISPETIVGQLRPTETKALIAERIASGTKRAEAWDGIFNSVEFQHMMDQSGAKVTIDFDDGTTREMSGRQLRDYIFDPGTSSASRPTGPSSAPTRKASSRCCWPSGIAERKEMQAMKGVF
jgi:DNA polymerase elongation subunit (family B)